MVALNPFADEVRRIADEGPLTDQEAGEFLQKYPLQEVFKQLQSGQLSEQTVIHTCAALDKVLATAPGGRLLPSLTPYAFAALHAGLPQLRRLGARQLGRILEVVPAPQQPELVQNLVSLLSDPDTGVATEAGIALAAFAESPEGFGMLISPEGGGRQLSEMASSPDSVTRLRTLSLLVNLASRSQDRAAALQQSGLLEPLLLALSTTDDLLSSVAALQLMQELADNADPDMANFLVDAVMDRLLLLAQSRELLLACSALKVITALLASAAIAGRECMEVDAAPLSMDGLRAVKRALDVNSAEPIPGELEEAALDAAAQMGKSVESAEMLATDGSNVLHDIASKAFGCAGSPSLRIAALHALASIAGCERAGAEPVAARVLMSAGAEAHLQEEVYAAAAEGAGAPSPGEVISRFLDQPFLELRVATYRATSALVLRVWGAGEVCRKTELLNFLCNPGSETSRQGCEWRYACVKALWATARGLVAPGSLQVANGATVHYDAILAAAPRIEAAIRAGVYNSGSARPETAPQVATARR
ncbi:hypothetical protein WJX72_006195 [[Myrmecia] bisecta]|uniref:Uncharacterized protein n=1 Tax=[Myrmecia] bisecta TaxID=41462 RepID=A0AAW1PF14_9CHLO